MSWRTAPLDALAWSASPRLDAPRVAWGACWAPGSCRHQPASPGAQGRHRPRVTAPPPPPAAPGTRPRCPRAARPAGRPPAGSRHAARLPLDPRGAAAGPPGQSRPPAGAPGGGYAMLAAPRAATPPGTIRSDFLRYRDRHDGRRLTPRPAGLRGADLSGHTPMMPGRRPGHPSCDAGMRYDSRCVMRINGGRPNLSCKPGPPDWDTATKPCFR